MNVTELSDCGASGSLGGTANDPRIAVNCDAEHWIQSTIQTAMRMALATQAKRRCRADDGLIECALAGIANGAAVEIIHTLGMRPGYVNLRPVPMRPNHSDVANSTP